MIRNIIILMISIVLTQPVFSESMMLSPAELEAIGLPSIDKIDDINLRQDAHGSNIHLDGIIFHHAKSWCIWLNGQKICYGQDHPAYKIVKVDYNFVKIQLVNDPNHTEPITLTIDQSH